MFLKKMLVFITTIIMVLSMCAVDTAYSEMMNDSSMITPQVKKTSSNYIVVSMFGKSANLNLNKVEASYEKIVGQFKEKLYGEESPACYSSIPRQTL